MCLFSSGRRHTICALVTGGQTCALPISTNLPSDMIVLETDLATPNFVPDADAQNVRNAGLLGRLSNQLVQRMLLYLRPEDVVNMTTNCRLLRSEERRVGKECVRTCRARLSTNPKKNMQSAMHR